MKLKRSAPAVHAAVVENKSGQVIAKRHCKIQAPVRFTEVGLGEVGVDTYIYGLYALILDTGEYAVMNVAAIMQLKPYKLSLTTIDDVDYYEFHFAPGDVVITTTSLVKREALMFNIADELFFKGKIPWYVEYEDLGRIYDTAKHHAGSNVAQVYEVVELLTSLVTRSKTDRTKQIRLAAKSYKDITIDTIDYVPLTSVYYSVSNTVNKIAGSYFEDGITSALVNPSDRVDKIEAILRS